VKSRRDQGLWLEDIEVRRSGSTTFDASIATGISCTDVHIYKWTRGRSRPSACPMAIGMSSSARCGVVQLADFFPGDLVSGEATWSAAAAATVCRTPPSVRGTPWAWEWTARQPSRKYIRAHVTNIWRHHEGVPWMCRYFRSLWNRSHRSGRFPCWARTADHRRRPIGIIMGRDSRCIAGAALHRYTTHTVPDRMARRWSDARG